MLKMHWCPDLEASCKVVISLISRGPLVPVINYLSPFLYSTDATDSTEKFSDFVACLENSELIENIATLLDQKSTVNKNWLHLGLQFKLSNETLKEIEYGPINPTEVLMKYMYSRKTDLTIGEFYDEVKKLKRHDVLKKLDFFIAGELKTFSLKQLKEPF